MSQHALLSPSSAARWSRCPGSVSMTKGMPDDSSVFADDGTATHELAAWCLTDGTDAVAYLGRLIKVNGADYVVDEDRAARAQMYVDYVRSLDGEILPERRLFIGAITGEPEAYGTSDAVVMCPNELVIVDLKDGRGVQVDAENNEQLAIYCQAALDAYDVIGYDRVRMVIVQPKLNHISEWSISVAGLAEFIAPISATGKRIMSDDLDAMELIPGEKQCRWCKAKANCPALADSVQRTIGETFADLVAQTEEHGPLAIPISTPEEVLVEKLNAVDLIEDWCRAVRAEAERRLFDGQALPGWKVVAGKKGARAWKDKQVAEIALAAIGNLAYEKSLISPTTAEKLAKAKKITPEFWETLQDLITQADGKPTVAPESDKRQAIQVGPNASMFADLMTA